MSHARIGLSKLGPTSKPASPVIFQTSSPHLIGTIGQKFWMSRVLVPFLIQNSDPGLHIGPEAGFSVCAAV